MQLETVVREGQGEPKGTILFVHGAMHAAWCWKHFMDWFPRRGWTSVAMSLRGHGASEGREHLDEFGLADYADDIAQIVSGMHEKPVIVAHSMGGMALQKYLADNPDGARAAVFFASMPTGGTPNSVALKLLFKYRKATKAMMALNSGKVLPKEEVANALIFDGRLSDEDVELVMANVQVESKRVAKEQQKPATDRFDTNVPVRIIGSSSDKMFPLPAQQQTAGAYGVQPVMLDGMCHDMMLDREWERGAQAILEAIG